MSPKKWHLTIIAPKTFCTNMEWGIDSNIIIAVVQKNVSIPEGLRDFDRLWDDRRNKIKEYIRQKLSQSPRSFLEVEIFSKNANFFPLIATKRNGNEFKYLNYKSVPNLHTKISGNCPVMMVEEDMGLAAFMMAPKSMENLNSLWHAPQRDSKTYFGTSQCAIAHLLMNNFIISETPFEFDFTRYASEFVETNSTKIYERVFASYAREDKCAVECVESIMQAFGIGYLRWDLKVLQAGVNWQDCVFDEISNANSFQLFWSENAKKSKNVKKEWKYALSLNRERFIKPVYWSDPLPNPPKELKNIHFSRVKLSN